MGGLASLSAQINVVRDRYRGISISKHYFCLVCGVCREGKLIPLFESKQRSKAAKVSKFAASDAQGDISFIRQNGFMLKQICYRFPSCAAKPYFSSYFNRYRLRRFCGGSIGWDFGCCLYHTLITTML